MLAGAFARRLGKHALAYLAQGVFDFLVNHESAKD
jgi:hypothetical protein